MQNYTDPEQLAAAYLSNYFKNQKIEYPINPFQMLTDEGILFSLSNFKKLEGVYIPISDGKDIPVVGINANRPITRQRFTAAHELCHHIHDANNKQITCPILGKKTQIERFADQFAAALLMPIQELKAQVNKRKNRQGNVSFDDVIEISEYFGVSFEACVFRIAYQIHAISGNIEPDELKRRIKKYSPDTVRKTKRMSYFRLYANLIDSFKEQLSFQPNDHVRYIFMNNYIYNDSRMEGVNVTQEQAAEI
ncbi:MAG: ImmA/IrrE family metallo-endopeptidase, partial [Synergistaceae bacterium]|nr:ImmA/IrrE family metallo-endopeptidase [Synergistaceae bacterium]